MNRIVYLFLITFVLLVGCRKHDNPIVHNPSAPFNIVKIGVLEGTGSEFDILLNDGRRIRGTLSVRATKESHNEVVAFINQSKAPQAILYNKEKDGSWLVDIKLIQCENGSCNPTSLTQWLKKKKLIWE